MGEVVDGKLVMSWNFGFDDGHVSATVGNIDDITQSSSFSIIKAGVATSINIVVLSFNFKLAINEKYDAKYRPDMSGDVYIGGIYCQDLNPAFKGILQNVDVHYRGCLRDIQFNGIVYDVSNAVENIGVTRGCVKEKITDLSFASEDSVTVASGKENVNEVSGTLGFCADISSGKIIEAKGKVTSVVTLPPRASKPSEELEEVATTTTAAPEIIVPETEAITEPPPPPPTKPPTTTTQPPTTTTTTEAVSTTTEFNLEPPAEQARMIGNPKLAGASFDSDSGSVLGPVVVLAAIVLIALVAAVIHAVMKSSSFAGGAAAGGGATSVFAPEEQPLNDVQPQRSAQVEW